MGVMFHIFSPTYFGYNPEFKYPWIIHHTIWEIRIRFFNKKMHLRLTFTEASLVNTICCDIGYPPETRPKMKSPVFMTSS